jgi:hypothetical protein
MKAAEEGPVDEEEGGDGEEEAVDGVSRLTRKSRHS